MPPTTYIRLANGTVIRSDEAERERHEFEARSLAAMPFEQRMAWLADIARIRGQAAADRLQAAVEREA